LGAGQKKNSKEAKLKNLTGENMNDTAVDLTILFARTQIAEKILVENHLIGEAIFLDEETDDLSTKAKLAVHNLKQRLMQCRIIGAM
jgi:hypothetical protein